MNPDLIRVVLLCLCWPVVLLRVAAVRVADQRLLWFTLVMQGLGLTVLQTPVMLGIQRTTGVPRIESLISSLLASVVAVLLLMVALRISSSDTVSARWSRRMALYCGATAVVMVTTFTVVTVRHIPTRDRFLPVIGEFSAHTVYWIAYLTYMIVVSVWTTSLFWRQIRRVAAKVLKFALLALALGTTTFLVFLGTRVASLFSASPQLPAFGVYVSSIYSISVTVGCSLAIILPLSQGVASWWRRNRLYPLWRALCDASPHIALTPPRSRWRDALTLRDNRHQLHRRLVEIRDGLLIMREWITPATHDRIVAALAAERLPNRDAAVTACWVRVALRVRANGVERVAKPIDLAGQGGVDTETELCWLTAVAKSWTSPVVARCAAMIDVKAPELTS
ncbi:MAB_1171c family putative transporter [Actinocrispum wychmicini]|uniref:DUF6545 domain-containing protein n=1 Tax=Actinocrispum wychmicini TaxID=1213861 RepID=A0A4R2J9Q5_9PSEU|nr:MAB_1171c family putative transporter [Actinocrispum wychmicini]TCO52649.1 hypothetical protein EV192_112381 [Actinocrispum wychmicini]